MYDCAIARRSESCLQAQQVCGLSFMSLRCFTVYDHELVNVTFHHPCVQQSVIFVEEAMTTHDPHDEANHIQPLPLLS